MNLIDIDVSFEGKSKRQELDAVLAMVKNLVEKNRAGWDCPLEGPISQCEAVKHWTELATALPFSETDVILGGHHFHLPAPKQFVPPPKDMVSEDVVSGVNRATMQLELDLPHSTFMNVDDDAVDYEAAMIAKQKAVIASRKRAAEKLLANSASGKRALVASKQGNVSGHARGYGARQTSSNAQGDPNDGENAEKDDVVEDKGKDGEDDKDESQDDDEEDKDEDGGGWVAHLVRGIGSTNKEKVYVVWNAPSDDDPRACEVTWSPLNAISNRADLFPSSEKGMPNRTDLKFGKELEGCHITGTFKYKDEDGKLVQDDEDGIVLEYDETKKVHTVQWDGDINVAAKDVGKDDKIKHNLMLTSKTNQMWSGKKWSSSQEILSKWYVDEDESLYAYPVSVPSEEEEKEGRSGSEIMRENRAHMKEMRENACRERTSA